LITPRAAEVPAAINQVAELYRAMGDLFNEKYYQLAVNTYQFLLRDYPANRYREDAMLAIAQVELDDLHDSVLARKSYEEFLTLHPHSPHVAEVHATLDRLRGDSAAGSVANTSASKDRPTPDRLTSDRPNPKSGVMEKSPAATDTKQEASTESSGTGSTRPHVTRIRTWNADTYTRIVIDVGAQVKYQAARLSNPDRIYFDVENAKIDPELLHKPVDVEGGGFLKSVRVGQNQLDVVRVVLEVDHAKDYSVSLLPNPYRLVVDVYGNSTATEESARANSPASGPAPGPAKDIPVAKPERPAAESASKTPGKSSEKTPPTHAAASASKVDVTLNGKVTAQSYSQMPQPLREVTAKNPGPRSTSVPATLDHPAPTDRIVESAPLSPPGTGSRVAPPPLVAHSASSKTKSARNLKSAHDQAEELGPASIPEPTRDGQQSLSRALGLKIGRIVIDAGHGGHDTGTIGPTGLMEKDLCLDVALRVGKLIQQRLPSAEVIYTREDDTFIGLEQRTEIANDARADLFLSVHANSSPDHKARGIETYYLNFTGSSDAMEVATRENALSENAVHDLQDILKKIARNEKIEESRDFAGTIQESLAKRVENLNRGDKSRGVRKAPFVVLIGANMPSVLAEISFISNPSDEQWLKKPENRQRIAEGLYHGIETYLQNTNSLTVNQIHPSAANHSGIVARSGNPQ
ncbi:MAG: N-acetylmuramoyl-L-alanine amidase, partial [Candidatus Acidoferrum typicum]|nr:N-acetylmuramoyl-L-alanine amidase [Candidatus Acidoferrum typicum]